jgi:hypothetical protein
MPKKHSSAIESRFRLTCTPNLPTLRPGQAYVLAYDYRGDPDYNYYAVPGSKLHGTAAPWRRIAEARDRIRRIGLQGDDIYALVPNTGGGLKLVRTKFADPDYVNAEVLLADTPEQQIVSFVVAPDALYVECSAKGHARLLRVPYQVSAKPVPLSLPYDGYFRPMLSGTEKFEGWSQSKPAVSCLNSPDGHIRPNTFDTIHETEGGTAHANAALSDRSLAIRVGGD